MNVKRYYSQNPTTIINLVIKAKLNRSLTNTCNKNNDSVIKIREEDNNIKKEVTEYIVG